MIASILILILKSLGIILPLLLVVAYFMLCERKIIGFMQLRIGPNRVGRGFLQPIADIIKLLCKEIIFPTKANKFLYIVAPMLVVIPSLIAWSVIPIGVGWVLADINVGLLFVFAMTSLSVYGIIIAGWASNSKYAFYGAIRSVAQLIAYEIAMGFCLVGVILAAGSLNLTQIVLAQQGGIRHWNAFALFPLFIVYWISALAETNRAPFDVAEGESEIVAGFHVEYSGMSFALFFLAEYANMILLSTLAALLFLGGWLSPIHGFLMIPGLWLALKISLLLFSYLWFRATFPRYRYDQIMRLGWKIFIPVTLLWVSFIAILIKFQLAPWFIK